MMPAKKGALKTPIQNVRAVTEYRNSADERRYGDSEHAPCHQTAAQQSHQIGVQGQHRQGQQQSDEARDHQNFDWVEAKRAQGVDLFVDLHRADLSGERTTRPAGDNDRRHQHTELTQDAYSQQIHRVDLGAKSAQLIGALVSDDHPDQKRQHADDWQRVEACLLHLSDHRGEPQPAWMENQPRRGQAHEAEKAENAVSAPE